MESKKKSDGVLWTIYETLEIEHRDAPQVSDAKVTKLLFNLFSQLGWTKAGGHNAPMSAEYRLHNPSTKPSHVESDEVCSTHAWTWNIIPHHI